MDQEQHNPYATALDGLTIDDPVAAFFDFCREREQIRTRRHSGAPAPWSDDPILQRGRFLNVFREDDRGSQAILRFAEPTKNDLPTLIHALFFARWCNRQSTLDSLTPSLLSEPARLRYALETLPQQPWCNVTAYPVEPVRYQGTTHSRFDTATVLFGQIKAQLTQAILSASGDVTSATRALNAMLHMNNDFPIFMAVMDIAWFRPDIIHPHSHVPTGIGAVAFLDRLQRHLGLSSHQETCEKMIALQAQYWPEAKRPLQPIDIEYLSCECRKYFSYQNGTKQFEGKNIFRPGESAQLSFDIAQPSKAHTVQTRIHVIAGGPCSGKTTVLNALKEAGYPVVPETARGLLEAGIAKGQTAEELRADPVQWQREIFAQDHALFESLPVDTTVFTDTSFIENLVFGARAGLFVGPNTTSWLHHKRYKTVFFLAPLDVYEESAVRLESQQLAGQISDQVWAQYIDHGYEPIIIPPAPVADRVALIQSIIEDAQHKT